MVRSTSRRSGGPAARAVRPSPGRLVPRVRRGLLAGVLVLLVLPAAACGSGDAPAAAPGPDPAVKPYCDTVERVRAEQTAPGAGQGGVAVASAATRRQIADLVRTAPAEIAGEWRTVQQLTERSLASLARTGGDPRRIDRAALDRARRAAEPAQERIRTVTGARCGVTFRAPG